MKRLRKEKTIIQIKIPKQYKIENDMIAIEQSDSDNNGIDEIAHGSEENGKSEKKMDLPLPKNVIISRELLKVI